MQEAFKIEAGQSFRVHHRVIFHKGDTASAKIADIHKAYAESEVSAPAPK